MMRCENCKLFSLQDWDEDDPTDGWCKRFPPSIPLQDGISLVWMSPEVSLNDWCGEHLKVEK